MGCCLSSHRRHRSETHDDSPPDYLPDDDDHLPNNRPPPNLALISSVRTLRSHLAMSPPSTPFNPRRPSPGEEDRILRDHHEEILYPIRFTQKHVSSSNPRVGGGRYGFVGNNQIAALDREVDHVFDDLSTATTTTAAAFNFSKEAQIGGDDDRTPSSRVGSGQWSIGSPTPVPLAEIWKRQNHRPPPPPPPADMWSSTAAPAKPPARALSKREVMSRRERERERGIRWDPSPETDFSDTSASTDSTTSAERRHRSTSMMESNRKAPRKVTFGELPMMRKGGDFEDGPGPGPRAARRVARSRPGGWSPPEVSESFEGWSLGTTTGGGSGRKQRQMGHGGMAAAAARGREDDVLIRQRVGSEYEPTNDLLSMEGFVFF